MHRFLIVPFLASSSPGTRTLITERAVPPIETKYNAEGDLLFSCSKDHVINAWYSHNGERLGTYDGHNGTVWTVDVDCTSSPVRGVLNH